MNKNAKNALNEYREKVKTGEIIKDKKPSMIKAIKLKCKECMGDYQDGKEDCETECPLKFWMPYSKERKAQKESKKKLKEKDTKNKSNV